MQEPHKVIAIGAGRERWMASAKTLLDACATASTVKMRGLSIVVIESPSGSRLAMGDWLELMANA